MKRSGKNFRPFSANSYLSARILHPTLRLITNILLIIGVIFAGIWFCTDRNDFSVSTGFRLKNNTVYEPDRVDSAALAVEKIFAASDTGQLAKILSPETLEKRRTYFAQLIKFMPSFAADFKTRKLQLARARYAVYEFKNSRGKFIVEFCSDSSGRWLLMNF